MLCGVALAGVTYDDVGGKEICASDFLGDEPWSWQWRRFAP
jgi:hypothetical protein